MVQVFLALKFFFWSGDSFEAWFCEGAFTGGLESCNRIWPASITHHRTFWFKLTVLKHFFKHGGLKKDVTAPNANKALSHWFIADENPWFGDFDVRTSSSSWMASRLLWLRNPSRKSLCHLYQHPKILERPMSHHATSIFSNFFFCSKSQNHKFSKAPGRW